MSGNVNFIGTQEEWDALVEKNKLRLLAMKKQTAVEWLVEQLAYHYSSININNTVIFEDAKAMMNEQIMDAYFSGIKSTGEGLNGEYAQGNSPNIKEKFQEEFEQYYTSTYE